MTILEISLSVIVLIASIGFFLCVIKAPIVKAEDDE